MGWEELAKKMSGRGEKEGTITHARSWYVIHTRSRFENVVNEGLLKKSKEVFLPKIKVKSKRRDRKSMIWIPLFPGYVFVKTDLAPYEHIDIVKTTGVVRLVGNKEGPVSVPENNIESLKIMVAADKPIETNIRFRRGHRIIVTNGPFTGVTGIFVRYKGIGRVAVNIQVLGQYAVAEVDEDDIDILPEILA